jgi:hypothetical protein
MKLRTLTAVVGLAVAQFAFADATAPQAPAAGAAPQVPQNAQQWLERMSDFTRNASAYRDPKVFVPWANAVTEPGFYTTMGLNMLEPGNWYRMFGSMMDPRSLQNYMQFADPNMYMKWMAASVDPNFYTALITQLTDPGKMMRWMMSPMDPQLWNLMLQSLNPNIYLKWMMAPLDPRLLQLSMQPLNPALYTSWLGATLNPATYGSWGTWMNPNTYTMPVTGGMSTVPTGTFNVFDPASWAAMFNVQQQPAAGQATAPAGTPAYVNPFDPNTFLKLLTPPTATAPAAAPAK